MGIALRVVACSSFFCQCRPLQSRNSVCHKRAAIQQVLLADDDRDIVDMMSFLLANLYPRAKIFIARDGVQAVALALSQRPDIALLDYEMPRMDGALAAESIRRSLGPAAPLLIALTGNPAGAAARGASAVFDHVMPKPLDLPLLARLIAEA